MIRERERERWFLRLSAARSMVKLLDEHKFYRHRGVLVRRYLFIHHTRRSVQRYRRSKLIAIVLVSPLRFVLEKDGSNRTRAVPREEKKFAVHSPRFEQE